MNASFKETISQEEFEKRIQDDTLLEVLNAVTVQASVLIVEGAGEILSGNEILSYRKGDSFFLPADSGEYEITGNCEALVTTIRAAVASNPPTQK